MRFSQRGAIDAYRWTDMHGISVVLYAVAEAADCQVQFGEVTDNGLLSRKHWFAVSSDSRDALARFASGMRRLDWPITVRAGTGEV